MIKRALISVFNKEGILDFSKFLSENGVEIISTGGTYKHLKDNGLKVTEVNEESIEMLSGSGDWHCSVLLIYEAL